MVRGNYHAIGLLLDDGVPDLGMVQPQDRYAKLGRAALECRIRLRGSIVDYADDSKLGGE